MAAWYLPWSHDTLCHTRRCWRGSYVTRTLQESDALNMLSQVEERDYNPPKRDRLLEWHAQQEFPILPHPDDPDCGNLYRNLKFPDAIYNHISQYQEQKAHAEQN